MEQSAVRLEPANLFTHSKDLAKLAADMCEVDAKECVAMGANGALWGLVISVMTSGESYVVFDAENEPLCAFGMSAQPSGPGRLIWFLGGKRMEPRRRQFVKMSRDILERWQKEHGSLYNFVSVENVKSIRWLKWLGAVFYEPQPMGVNGELFQLFVLGGDGDVQFDNGPNGSVGGCTGESSAGSG